MAAGGRRAESARPEEREGEHLHEAAERDEDRRRERDALAGVKMAARSVMFGTGVKRTAAEGRRDGWPEVAPPRGRA